MFGLFVIMMRGLRMTVAYLLGSFLFLKVCFLEALRVRFPIVVTFPRATRGLRTTVACLLVLLKTGGLRATVVHILFPLAFHFISWESGLLISF